MPLLDLTVEELRFIGSVLLDAPLPMRTTHPIMEKIEAARAAATVNETAQEAASVPAARPRAGRRGG